MKKIILILIVLFSFVNTHATHIMGGEITWECIKDPSNPDVGKYIFKMKVYYDCDGTSGSAFAQTIDVWGHPSVTSIILDWELSTDISPSCDVINSGFPALDCITNPIGAVEEYLYESQPVALPGLPPVSGWHFTWDSCCRNWAVTNIPVIPGVTGFTLRASMFPYFDAFGNVVPA